MPCKVNESRREGMATRQCDRLGGRDARILCNERQEPDENELGRNDDRRRGSLQSQGLGECPLGPVAGGDHAFAPPSTVKPVPFTERASGLAMKA